MNISHRSIWNSALGAWVAVSEITRACGKRSGGSLALASSGALALGLLLAPSVGLAQNHGATGGGAAFSGGGHGGGAAGAVGLGLNGGAAGTSVSPYGVDGGVASGGGGGYSNEASGDVSMALQGGGGGKGAIYSGGSGGGIGGSGGGGGGDGVRITSAGPVSIDVGATVRGGSGGSGGGGGGSGGLGGGGGGGGGGAGVVFLGNSTLTTRARISGGDGGGGGGGGGSGGGGGAGVILQGAGQLSASGGITGGDGGGSTSYDSRGNAGVGVLMVGSGSVTTTVAGIITGGASTGTGSGGAGVSLLAGGTIANAGTIQGGNGGGSSSGWAYGQSGGTGSGGAAGNTNSAMYGVAGAGITGAGLTITNSGTIAGGIAQGFGVRANAITFTGGTNSLELQAGYSFTGNVNASAGISSTLILGGNTNPTSAFDVSMLVASAGATNRYVGFNAFSKTGTSTWTLTGSTTTATPWTVNAGTLAITSDGNLGASSGVLTLDGGRLRTDASMTLNRTVTLGASGGSVDTNGYDLTVSGVMSGAGGLSKTGAGTLTLSGTNNYTGGTTISAGTLQIDNVSALGSTTAITNNGSLVFNALGVTTVTANVAGTGSLTQAGTGITVLHGASTYSGTTNLSAGTLQALNSAAFSQSSAFTVNAPATLNLNGFDESIGSLAGGGSVTAGGGRLTTGSDNTSTTFSGVISGTGGGVTKTGTGTFTLSGVNTYTGATTVNAGTLSVNGAISNSAVTVNSGGTLGGGGTLGNTTIASGGILAPGNSIGTLNVAGNLSFAAGSIYRVEIDAAGANDRINATGTATINGGTVDVQAGAGSYAANTTYTVLNATGGRTGTFTGVSSDLAFLTPTLGYDANNVFLTLARNDISFSAVAITPNQIAISTALQNAATGATGDMSTVLGTLTGLSATQARAAYDSASGAGLMALRGAGTGFAAGLGSQLQARLGAVQSGGAGALANSFANRSILLAANSHGSDLSGLLNTTMSDAPVQQFSLASGKALPSAATTQGRGFWLRGSGGYQDTKTDGNAAASQQRNTALSAGFDTQLQEGLVVGAALSSGTSRLSFDNNDAGKSRGSALAVYGSYAAGPWAFKASASAGWNDNHMDRTVTVGALVRQASADFNSHTLSAYGEASYSLPMNGWTLKPVAALSVTRDKADGFTETGAGALNLQVAGQTNDSAKSLLGAKASFEAGKLSIEPRAIWAHEFGDLNTPMTAQFQGAASASPFQVAGVALKRDTLILGLGASSSIGQGMDLFADVQLEHNARQRHAGVMVGLRASW